jgi:hypothetical protein
LKSEKKEEGYLKKLYSQQRRQFKEGLRQEKKKLEEKQHKQKRINSYLILQFKQLLTQLELLELHLFQTSY